MASAQRKAAPPDRGRSPLDHWLAQEQAAEAGDDPGPDADADLADLLAGQRLPSGWWMLPALVLALPFWAFLIRMILRS